MSPVNVSTKRTAVNITVVLWAIAILNKVFNWHINLSEADAVWLAPIIGLVAGVGYRISRWATSKWPTLGWLLFGSGKEPAGIKPIAE